MESLIFSNENGSIDLSLSAPYILQSVTGIGGLGVSVRTQKSPFQNGSTRIASYYDNRDITLTFMALACSESEIIELRRQAQRLFNPNIESTLTYVRGDYTKEIKCYANSTPSYNNDEKTSFRQQFFVSLTAHDPFWVDIESTGQIMSFSIGNFGFELEIEEDGIELETEGTNRTTLSNEGDVETPVEIIFTGPASNPKIMNETTGKFIQVNKVLGLGESLIINTEFGNKKVMFDDGSTQTNAFNSISLDSTFWRLQTGDNEVSYTADSGIDVASVVINFKNRFIGI